MQFTAHNIALDDGTQTKPGGFPMGKHPRLLAALRCLRVIFPCGFQGLRIVDLGCLEGGYAVEFARAGFGEVLGIEARPENFASCQTVKQRVDLPNLTFVNDDARSLAAYGMFDAIFCCGLLYHLDRPAAFLELMARATRRVALVHTHYATDRGVDQFRLSDETENEGLTGRWYPEDDSPWAAFENRRSFWPRKEHLVEAIRAAGFGMVLEQFDCFKDVRAINPTDADRAMFVGIKEPT